MKTPVLIINRHPIDVFYSRGRCLVPTDRLDAHLVTHDYGGVREDMSAYATTSVCDVRDDATLEVLCIEIIRTRGVRRVIALHEKAVMLAARLRMMFGLEGLSIDTATQFRDKVVMKTVLRDAGIRVPRFTAVDTFDDLARVDFGSGPYVLKPRDGVGAVGAAVVSNPSAAEEYWRSHSPAPGELEIEEYIDGDLYHVDAAVEGTKVVFASVARYIARPGEFRAGAMAGSHTVPSGPLVDRIVAMTAAVVSAYALEAGVVHLELFHTPRDELVFLEIAARPGGGGITQMIERAYGVNMVEAAIHAEAGLSLSALLEPGRRPKDAAVWAEAFFFPASRSEPARLGVPLQRFSEFAIAEHQHVAAAVGREPRHAGDFVDLYVLAAPDVDRMTERLAALDAAYSENAPHSAR